MKIEHKTTPIEHVIDGVLVEQRIVDRICENAVVKETVAAIDIGQDSNSIAVVEFEVKRTPVPELGPGWYLLRDDEVLQVGDKVNATYGKEGWIPTACAGVVVRDWRQNVAHHVCARNFGVAEFEAKPNPIDWTKPVRTKDGRSVRVLCTDGPGEYPVVGIIDGNGVPQTWTLIGEFSRAEPSVRDLENAPQRIQKTWWMNVFDGGSFDYYETKEAADADRGRGIFACVPFVIDCEEGEGL